MILKVVSVLCALILSQVCSTQAVECKVGGSADTLVTMSYQDGALLRVISGTLTVKLLGNESTASPPKVLYAEDKGIVNVTRGFARIPSLEYLSLEDNSIERIESFVFDGLPQLVHLSLARNKINHLVADSFAGLGKLEVLNLKHNALTEFRFSISHAMLPSLRELHLQHNKIGGFSVNSYQNELICSSNLRYLYLSYNSLSNIYLNSDLGSRCLEDLTHLFLENNYLSEIDIRRMSLEALSLDDNRLSRIPAVDPDLKFLSLASNNIGYINRFSNNMNIACLILSYNIIQVSYNRMDLDFFQNIPRLEHLALDGNRIDLIPAGFLSNSSSLRSVYLTNNYIRDIPPTSLSHLPSLLELYLDNNRLSSFPGKECFGRSQLRYLDISNNKIEKISDLEVNMIPNLKVLKLTGNPLHRIEPHSVSSDVEILF